MKHVALVIANNSSVPYFNWFAQTASVKEDVKITFIALCKDKPAMIEEVAKYGWECIWIRFNHEKRKRGWFFSTIKLFFLFRKLKPDIVHTHLFDDSLPALLAAKFAGIKRRIVTKGDTAYHWYFARKGVFADLIINDFATDIVAASNESKQFILEKEKGDVRKVKCIHHGLMIENRLNLISETKKNHFIDKFGLRDKKVVGTVARLVEWKGHFDIIEAARLFCHKNPDCVFLIIGNGGLLNELKKKVENFGLSDNIIYTGWINPDDIPSLFDLFDIFLHAAFMEPFGFVIAEAMAHSIPVLSTNTGAARDVIIHKQNGYLVEPKKPEQIAEGLEWIFNSGKKEELGTNGFKTASEKFEFGNMYGNYVNLYNSSSIKKLDSVKDNSVISKRKKIFMIIANSSNPSYFRWFAELNHKENKFELHFIFLHTELPQMASEVKQYGVESHWFFFNTYKSKPVQYFVSFLRFYTLFSRKSPDVVHTNLFDDSLPALFAAKCAFVPSRIITKQDTGFHVNFTPNIVVFDKFNNWNATRLIACSEESKEFILDYERGNSKNVSLIYHGVDEQFITTHDQNKIDFIKSKFGLKDKFVIGTVARYIDLKGYPVIIKAASKIIKEYPNIVFFGVGWGRQMEVYKEMIANNGMQDNFILTDKLEYEMMPSVYRCMDLYLHAAQIEPFGFVIAEAMFNKVPVISTRVGASRDFLIHKENAYLIDFDNSDQIIEGIKYFRDNSNAINNRMTEKAYEIARENFSREKMWAGYRDMFLSN